MFFTWDDEGNLIKYLSDRLPFLPPKRDSEADNAS